MAILAQPNRVYLLAYRPVDTGDVTPPSAAHAPDELPAGVLNKLFIAFEARLFLL